MLALSYSRRIAGVPAWRAAQIMVTYQTILVHIDRSAECRSRLGVGISQARHFAARLVGVYFDDAPEITPSLAALLPSDTVERYMRNAVEAQRAGEDAFRQAAAAAGVTDVEWRAPAGVPIDAAVAHARCADLTVATRALLSAMTVPVLMSH